MECSVLNYYGKHVSNCGYCKGEKCSIAHGMHAYSLHPQDYQDLIDRGWRRSGQYCYKLDNKASCCSCYTIRCNTLEFKLSKSHKKVLKRMNRFLRDGIIEKTEQGGGEAVQNTSNKEESGGENNEQKPPSNVSIPDINLAAVVAANPKMEGKPSNIKNVIHQEPQAMDNKHTLPNPALKASGYPCKKAKQMRLERRQAKGACSTKTKDVSNKEKFLFDYINEAGQNDKHKLKLQLVDVGKKSFMNTLSTTFALYNKYQTRVHNDPPDEVKDYLDFLQRSPIKHLKACNGPDEGYGSFHQQYWLDDKLIAVGVIDILPYCVSSVYFFYDPDYSFLSLGTYGSLREIEFVQQLAKHSPSLKYYYMGFYIHSCPKMRYKGKLMPSHLLCPETYTWHLLTEEMCASLDEQKYLRLNKDPAATDVNDFTDADLDEVLLLGPENKIMTYQVYIQITGEEDDRDIILEYGKLVGKQCAHRMLYLKV